VLSNIELQEYTTSLLSLVPCALLHRTSRAHNKKSTGNLCFLILHSKRTQVYWYPVLSYIELPEYITKSQLVPCAFLHRTSRVHNKSTGTLCFLTQNFKSTQVYWVWYPVLYYTELQEYIASLLVTCAFLNYTPKGHKYTGTLCFLT
jgi:hypothetical protein